MTIPAAIAVPPSRSTSWCRRLVGGRGDGCMRRIVLLVLVAALASAAGAAGANGTLSRLLSGAQARLLGDVRVGGTPSAAQAGHRSATASALAAATDGPSAARTAPAASPREGATAGFSPPPP